MKLIFVILKQQCLLKTALCLHKSQQEITERNQIYCHCRGLSDALGTERGCAPYALTLATECPATHRYQHLISLRLLVCTGTLRGFPILDISPQNVSISRASI